MSGSDGQVIKWSDSSQAWEPAADSSGGGLTATAVKTSTYLASAEERVLYDPSNGTGFAISASSSPSSGTEFAIKNVNSSSLQITLQGNGEDIENPFTEALTGSFEVAVKFISLHYHYDGTNWVLI